MTVTTLAYDLRPATAHDASFIYDLREAGLREHVAQLWGWDDGEQRARFGAMFNPARYQVVVGAGQDVGAISVVWRPREAFLADIEIAPEWRGKGLGTTLLTDLLASAHQLGLPVTSQVLTIIPARRLYERLGFRVVAEASPHYLMRTPMFERPDTLLR